MPTKVYEKQIENQILEYLNMIAGWYAFKLKDQAPFRDGQYRNPGKWCPKGIADLVALIPGGKVLFLEIKTKSGQLSPAQEAFADNCQKYSVGYHVIRSLQDAKDLVEIHSVSECVESITRMSWYGGR